MLIKQKTNFATALLFFGFVCCGCANAFSLIDATKQALQFDPVFKSFGAQREAVQEQRAQAVSQLLPQVSFQQMHTKNSTDTAVVSSGSGANLIQSYQYPSDTKAISLRQPIVKPRLVFNVMQGDTKAQIGEAQWQSARQKTIARATSIYITCLAQDENLSAARADLHHAELKMRQTEMLRKAGEVSDVELEVARASLALTRAKLKEAASSSSSSRRELAAVVGDALLPLGPKEEQWEIATRAVLALLRVSPNDLGAVDISRNPEVVAQQLSLEVARLEVKKYTSDHLPTFDFVASLSEGTSAQDIAINRYTKTRSVGVQLTIPIYSGGMTQSSIREQVALSEKAMFDLDAIKIRIENERERARDELVYRLDVLDAGLADLKASRFALAQAELGTKSGLMSDVDVAERRAKRARSLGSLARSVAETVVSYTSYLVAVGSLSEEHVELVSGALDTR